MLINLLLVSEVFCSNTKYLDVDAINFFTAINNLLTLILSNADALSCNVFCPNATIPCPGKEAIGFTLFSLSTSCHYVQHVCILFDTFSFVKAATSDTVLCSICWLLVSTSYLQYSLTNAIVSNIMIAGASHIFKSDSMFSWCASLLIVHSCFRDLHPFCKGTLMSISF